MATGSFNTILTERLVLRSLKPEDGAAFFAYRKLPEVARYQAWQPHTMEDIEAFMGRVAPAPDMPDTWFQLAVCLKDGTLIGDAGLHFPQDEKERAEIGYTVSPSYQRRGYASEAVEAILAYLFGILGKRRVTASIDPRNAASAAVLKKSGFKKEAFFTKSVLINGEWCDDQVYSLTYENWKSKSKRRFEKGNR